VWIQIWMVAKMMLRCVILDGTFFLDQDRQFPEAFFVLLSCPRFQP
jgi:hypothetical protein